MQSFENSSWLTHPVRVCSSLWCGDINQIASDTQCCANMQPCSGTSMPLQQQTLKGGVAWPHLGPATQEEEGSCGTTTNTTGGRKIIRLP